MEVNVVPAFSVRLTPALAIVIPVSAKPVQREIHVSVTNGTSKSRCAGKCHARIAGRVEGDTGRGADSLCSMRTNRYRRGLRSTTPAQAKIGEYTLRAVVTSAETGDEKFTEGYQDIEYPHIERRQVIKPAETALKIVDVKVIPGISVGYVERRR